MLYKIYQFSLLYTWFKSDHVFSPFLTNALNLTRKRIYRTGREKVMPKMDAYNVEICENKTFQPYFLFYLKDIKEQRVWIRKIFKLIT